MTKIGNHEMGMQWQFEDYLVFFGDRNGSKERLVNQFAHLEWRNINQVHGDGVVDSSGQPCEADAHYTKDPYLALQIKTADCLPIFAVDPVQKAVVGIHAGWRGVANQITMKALDQLRKLGGEANNFRLVIGPHIRRQSFEVDEPVWVQLMDAVPVSYNHQIKYFYDNLPGQKYRVDLEAIVRAQAQDLNVPTNHIDTIKFDTLVDSRWHSYRRDRETSGRNISFVTRFR